MDAKKPKGFGKFDKLMRRIVKPMTMDEQEAALEAMEDRFNANPDDFDEAEYRFLLNRIREGRVRKPKKKRK